MWPDPFDPKRRRLSYMKGTPANVYSFLLPAAGVIISVGLINLIPYIPHAQRKFEKIRQNIIDSVSLRQMRKLEWDPVIGKAIAARRTEHEADELKDWIDMN